MIEQTLVAEAHAMIRASGDVGERGAYVIGKEGWHPGVIGIVASRVAETYHRPAVVIALNDAGSQGSARSIPGFNLYEALKSCSEGLTAFGGHAAAAGLRLPASGFAAFAERFDQHCRASLTPEQKDRVLWIDAEVPLGSLNIKLIEEIERLEPYGMGNPRPLLSVNQVRLIGDPKIVGARKNHVQLRVKQGDVILKAIAWNMADRCKSLKADTMCSLAFQPSINEWNGRRDVQLEVKDFHVEGGES